MKKIFLGAGVIAAAIVGGLLLLRSMEPSIPKLPPPPPPEVAATVEKKDLASLMQSQQGPAQAQGQGVSASSPTLSAIDAGLPDDLLVMLHLADDLGSVPDPDRSYEECLIDPVRAAKKYGVNRPPDVDNPLGSEMASLMCSRDLKGCDKFAGALGAASGGCANPPCKNTVLIAPGESVEPSAEGCRQWASYMIFLADSLEGKDNLEACRGMMAQEGGKWLDSLLQLCPQIAQDYRTGDAESCRILAQKSSAEMARSLCPNWTGFLKGEDSCAGQKYGGSGRPTCALRARVREALVTKDPARCRRDPLCLAFLSTAGCDPENFVDTRGKAWDNVCRSAAIAAMMKWTNDVADKGQFARDRLPNYRTNLSLIPEAKRDLALPRIESAIAKLDKSLREAKVLRDKMNKGQITTKTMGAGGASYSPSKTRSKKSRKKR